MTTPNRPSGPVAGEPPPAPRRLEYYEHHGRVARREPIAQDEERAAAIRAAIPPAVRTILDFGCGVGLVTRRLASSHQVVGLDVSLDVHRGAQEPRVCGLATEVPFRDRSVDLALATQIFEHLTDGDLRAVAGEMLRVSRRYLMITTTLCEDLQEAMVPCPACGTLFNAYGHLRTFDARSLAGVFPSCAIRHACTYAPARPYPRPLVRFNQSVLGFWHNELALLCTQCGNKDFPRGRRGLARLSMLSNALARIWPMRRQPTRILMLFEKP